MAKNYTVILPDDLQNIDAIVCSRSELEHIIGMVEAVTYSVPEPYNDLMEDIRERLEKLKNGKGG